MARVHFGHHSTMHLTPERRKVLVYAPKDDVRVYHALEKVLGTLFDKDKIVLSHDLEEDLRTGEYGLLIDVSCTFRQLEQSHIDGMRQRIESLGLEDSLQVEYLAAPAHQVTDIARLAAEYFRFQKSEAGEEK